MRACGDVGANHKSRPHCARGSHTTRGDPRHRRHLGPHVHFRPTFRTTEFNLLLLPAMLAIVGSLTIVLVGRGAVDWSWSDIWISLAASAAVLVASITFGIR